MKGRIAEVFDSVQGEGIYLGEKQIFVRFFGCNLSCKFCDTKLNRFTEYEPEELLEELKLYQDEYHSISFTGGEPLLQKDFLKEILRLSAKSGYRNYLETNGTLWSELEEVIEYLHFVAMDLKFPSSTQMGNVWGFHRKFLGVASKKEVFLKAIICDSTKEQDLMEALSLIKDLNKSAILVLQPNSQENLLQMKIKLERFREICLGENVTACIIPQMHKIVGIK
jgi:7-carboxy-7-deazaguanine synthase